MTAEREQLEDPTAEPPRRARTISDAANEWGPHARRFVQDNPVAVLLGAFVLGIVLARVARHA